MTSVNIEETAATAAATIDYKIINILRTSQLPHTIDLGLLHKHIPTAKYYTGRPKMFVLRLTNGRNIQLFQNGKIQVLGAISNSVAQQMKYELQVKILAPFLLKIREQQHHHRRQKKKKKKEEHGQYSQQQWKKYSRRTFPHLSKWEISNLVISVDLQCALKLMNIPNSNHEIFYEPDILAACLINAFKPVHIAVFHNGKAILTGLKSERQIPAIVRSLLPIVSPYMCK